MIYHIDDSMKRNILDELDFRNIKVNRLETFIYHGFRINLVNRTIECLNPIKNIIVKK